MPTVQSPSCHSTFGPPLLNNVRKCCHIARPWSWASRTTPLRQAVYGRVCAGHDSIGFISVDEEIYLSQTLVGLFPFVKVTSTSEGVLPVGDGFRLPRGRRRSTCQRFLGVG